MLLGLWNIYKTVTLFPLFMQNYSGLIFEHEIRGSVRLFVSLFLLLFPILGTVLKLQNEE